MATFLFSYRRPEDYAPPKGTQVAWGACLAGMGDSLMERAPVLESRQIGNGDADIPHGDYTVFTADDLETALAVTRGFRSWRSAAASRSACLRSRSGSVPQQSRHRRPVWLNKEARGMADIRPRAALNGRTTPSGVTHGSRAVLRPPTPAT